MTITMHSETHENKVLIEQVRILFQSTFSLLLVNLVVSVCLAIGFWDVVPRYSILLWFGLMLVMLTVRALLFLYFKHQFDTRKLLNFRLLLVLGSCFAGVIWGLGGLLLFLESQLEYQVFLLFALMAMIGGSTFTLSIYLPTYFAFAPLTLLPITVKLMLLGDQVHYSLAAVSLAFLATLTAFNIKINANFKRSLNLRFENFDLIEQLRVQKEEADRANTAKSKFLAAASHDLRQPLYSLSLFTSVLDELTENGKTRKIVEQINLSVEALKNLFDALLDISKLDAGVVEVNKCSLSVQALFKRLANEFDLQAAQKGIRIEWQTCPYWVESEETLLEQILMNYLSNAIRYTDECAKRGKNGACGTAELDKQSDGTKQSKVIVSCRLSKDSPVDELIISVTDTGIGIAAHELNDIFSEFHQVGNPQRNRNKGLGLGLAIVKRTAKLLEHKISVTSLLGKGSSFNITVPLAEHELTNTETSLPAGSFNTNSENSVVVVIDDEATIRDGMQQLLTLWGYQVIASATHVNALAQLQECSLTPNVIIADFRLANKLTGVDAIQAIRTQFKSDIPALMVTGEIAKENLASIHGFDFDVLYKPVPAAKLRSFLRSIQKN